MTPANVARATASTDSIKDWHSPSPSWPTAGCWSAEPVLRRAVPILIITFLVTMAVGTGVQILDHRYQTLAAATVEIELRADLLASRLDSLAGGAKDAKDGARLAREIVAAAAERYGDRETILVSDQEGTIIVGRAGPRPSAWSGGC